MSNEVGEGRGWFLEHRVEAGPQEHVMAGRLVVKVDDKFLEEGGDVYFSDSFAL